MITLPAKITGLIVTAGMGMFFAAVAILCVVPLIQAIVERRMPAMPNLPALFENLGIALAIAGFTFRATDVAALGVGLALFGAVRGYRRRGNDEGKNADNELHPFLHKAILFCGVLSVGALGEFYYLAG